MNPLRSKTTQILQRGVRISEEILPFVGGGLELRGWVICLHSEWSLKVQLPESNSASCATLGELLKLSVPSSVKGESYYYQSD